MVLGGQPHSDPFAEMRRAATDINGNVEDFTDGDTNQFALSVFQLVVQAAQYAFLRARMIVLDELCVQASRLFKSLGIEAFIKEASLITKYLRFDDQNTGQISGDYIHG
ncbi:hypothetical protein D3C80_1515900 [compost metagenome]